MRNRTRLYDSTDIKKSAIKKIFYAFLGILTVLIFLLEFFYDLKKELLFYRIVIGLDVVLLIIFFLMVLQKIYQNRTRIFDLISEEKSDVVYAILILIFLHMPRLAAGLVMVRLLIAVLMRGLESQLGTKLLAGLNLRPSQTLALSFIGLIATGTILLVFPAATTDGHGATFLNALFTMTSASCVSGLTVYNIGADFTRFGQAVILFGIQAGGLGIMVLSAAFVVLVGGALPFRHQAGLREVLDVSTPEGLKKLIRAVCVTTIVTEFIGALLLFFLWRDHLPYTSERLWWSVFHAVSAFCNAGMSLSPISLIPFVNDLAICFVFMILITIGGVGFFVILDFTNPDVWSVKKTKAIWNRLQIQTKVVIIATILLNCLGMLLFLFFEYDGALKGLAVDKKIAASLFYAVSLRSAGFTVVPLGDLAASTIIFGIAFMFIGASPGSTGGGIKITTAAVSVMALRAMLRGRDEVELLGRRMPPSVVNRSLSIVIVAGIIIAVFLISLVATQDIEFEKLFFETVSAFGTVGLSIDTTNLLNDTGKVLIIFVMYIGRIGPLTLAIAIGQRKIAQGYQLPKGRIAVG
jgi:trk system potassium uptake protein TrkH